MHLRESQIEVNYQLSDSEEENHSPNLRESTEKKLSPEAQKPKMVSINEKPPIVPFAPPTSKIITPPEYTKKDIRMEDIEF